MNPICLFTVVYPGCEPFLPRFFKSVKTQTVQDFDLIILNDGMANPEEFIPVQKDRVHLIPVDDTIAKVREKGLELLIHSDYDKIIFADADDFFSKNRIEMAAIALETVDIYVNDLSNVNMDGDLIQAGYFSKRLNDDFKIEKEFLLQKNITGLGNTSVRRSALKSIEIPKSTIAVDWMIFTEMLNRNCTATFNNNSFTYYRQHETNTVGFSKVNSKRVRHALKVHFQNAEYFASVSQQHQNHLNKLKELDTFLSEQEENFKDYLSKIKQNLHRHPFWWEEIKTLDQLSL